MFIGAEGSVKTADGELSVALRFFRFFVVSREGEHARDGKYFSVLSRIAG
jgi:hypothetical protein